MLTFLFAEVLSIPSEDLCGNKKFMLVGTLPVSALYVAYACALAGVPARRHLDCLVERFFEAINRGSYKDPRLRKIIMDGKNFVKLTDEKFDVIMNDSTYPGTTGSSALYTYDHFRQCREHLEPGGVLSCWVPLDLRPDDFAIIVLWSKLYSIKAHITYHVYEMHLLLIESKAPEQ
jgi:hypothetical protein